MKRRSSKNGEYFLIVFTGEQIWSRIAKSVERIFIDFWSSNIADAYIIATADTNDDVIAKLYTFFPYNEKSCGKANPIVVNEYRKNGFVSELNVFVDKLKNMHKCPLSVAIPANNELLYLATDAKGKPYLDGFESHILVYIAKAMNFKVDLKPYRNSGSRSAMKMMVGDF